VEEGRTTKPKPSSSAEVKNEWSCTPVPPVCVYGVDKEGFTFLPMYLFVFYVISLLNDGIISNSLGNHVE
jgi:hypothetical protein